MLKFLKKTYGREKNPDSASSSPLGTPGLSTSPSANNTFFANSQSDSIFGVGEVEKLLTDSIVVAKTSRLCKTLVHLISDSESLSYFIQYLDAVNATTLAKCLLDIDNLNAASPTRSKKLNWKSMRGFDDVKSSSPSQIRKEFCCGLDYSNSLACDISGYSDNSSNRTYVRTPSEAKLREMQNLENEKLEGLFELSEVFESTVDALRLFYKYFSYKAPFQIILGTETFERLLDGLRDYMVKEAFGEVRQLVFSVLENEFYSKYLKSDYHCKYQMSVLTGTQVRISDFLYNEQALFYFMEFLEQEGHRTLLEFWMAANNFQMTYEGTPVYDAEQAQTDAMVLYDKYFSLQATQSLQLGDKVRFLVEQSICREAGTLPTCFNQVQDLIVTLLERKFLGSFLQSQLFFNFLSELISAVSASPPPRPGGSDCSSEISSISAPHVLPLSEEKKDSKNWESTSLNMDTRHLYDPDALWRRGKHNSLTFGRVNSLGRFETAMEPEPRRNSGLEYRISKAVKRFVNLDEDKSKEEMAWQVAEMYIKDVTSVTMPSNEQ